MVGNLPYNCYLVECSFQDSFKIAGRILVLFPTSFFCLPFVSINVVHRYISIGKTTVWKKSRLIISDRSDFYMVDSLAIAAHAFARHKLTSLSVNEIFLLRNVNLSTNFRETLFRMQMAPHGDTDFFDIVPGVLQGDVLASYLFMICLGHILRTSIVLIKENGFTLKKGKM